jgi:GTP cyclohydrolase I
MSGSDPMRTPTDYAHDAVKDLLQLCDPDPDRQGLKETPERMVRSLKFLTAGQHADPAETLKVFEDGAQNYDQMVVQGGISLYSLCEHHIIPFFGVAHIAYIPNGKIVGLSKIARLVEVFSRRLQVQERLTTQIADAMNEHLQPIGVGVVLRCRHFCIETRGVQKQSSITLTSALRGAIKDEPETREEFLHFVQLADAKAVI